MSGQEDAISSDGGTELRAAMGWPGWTRPTWGRLLLFGLATRVVVVLLGLLLARVGPRGTMVAQEQTVAEGKHDFDAEGAWSVNARSWIEPWYHFDALWYAHTSERGYAYTPGRASSIAFLPLLPLIMQTGEAVGLDHFWVGLIVPNLAFALGLAAFGRVALRVTEDAGTAWKSCLLLTAYPWSFFFSCPYQESLAFALTAGAILAWQDRRPSASALALAAATTARLAAVAVSAAILAEWAHDLARRRPSRQAAWLVALAGPCGFGLFAAYCYWKFGDPLVHLKGHQAWKRQPASLVNVLRMLSPGPSGLKNYAVMILFLGLGIRTTIKRGPFWGCLVLVPVLMGMASGTRMSMTRITLTSFPAFIDVAELLRGRAAPAAVIVASILLQAYFIYMHVNRVFVA
ncbi:MAG: mannosyltransferase family protein [Singulisphaera sp.]